MKRTRLNRISHSSRRKAELEADQLWSATVLATTNGKCAKCGRRGAQPAHIIPRRFKHHRHDPQNGIPLCHRCHQWADNGDPAAFHVWLAQNYPAKEALYVMRFKESGPVTATAIRENICLLKHGNGAK